MTRSTPGNADMPADTQVCFTRRAALRMGAAGIGGALAWRATSALAQSDATPGAISLPPVVGAWLDAYNARDHAAMAALYTADAVYEDVPNQFQARGDEIPSFLATAETGLGDVRIELTGGFGDAHWAAIEYFFHATNLGLIPIPGTEGASFTSRAVTIFELGDGLIRRSSDYYDLMAILGQIGALPPLPSGEAALPGTPLP